MPLDERQNRLIAENTIDFSSLRALFINATLKPTARAHSHTEDLMRDSIDIMESCGVAVDYLRAADYDIAFGVSPDMRAEGVPRDDWPENIWPKVKAAHILVLGTPIWLGEESSICRVVIERLYAHSGQTGDDDQYVFYGKAGGTVVTGNEDGIKHVAKTVLYSLQHIGYLIPPQADTGWIGEAGPGPSYGDRMEDGRHVGYDSTYTRRTLTFMTFNLMHSAKMMHDNGGIPSHGNRVAAWQ